MTVYVEYVFLVNLAANATLVAVTLRAMRFKVSVLRTFLAAAVGAGAAVLFAYIPYGFGWKILLSVVMLFFIFRWQNLRQYLTVLPVFYLVSALFAGGSMFFNEIGLGAVLTQNGNYDVSPILTAVAFVAVTLIAEGVLSSLYKRRATQCRIYRVDVSAGKTTVKTEGFFDTGNTLSEKGQPVVVVSALLGKKLNMQPTDTIPVMTVTGIKILPSLNLTVKIYYGGKKNKLYKARGVISDKPLKAPLILNSEFQEEL